MVQTKSDELRGILDAYFAVCSSCWPELHPDLESKAASWRHGSRLLLQKALHHLLREAAKPPREVRVFWKLGDDLAYAGSNLPFARDASFASEEQLVGRTDFDRLIPWTRQAANQHSDDREVIRSGEPKLFMIERQELEHGVFWLHAGKAPIFNAKGEACGILGMYETIDSRQITALMKRKQEFFSAA